MTTADFSNKQVILNMLNSMISGVIMVLQRMYLGRRGNAKILLKIFSLKKQRWHCITHGAYNPITVTHKTHGQNIQILNEVELKMVTYR
jgi:hypothetical protein